MGPCLLHIPSFSLHLFVHHSSLQPSHDVHIRCQVIARIPVAGRKQRDHFGDRELVRLRHDHFLFSSASSASSASSVQPSTKRSRIISSHRKSQRRAPPAEQHQSRIPSANHPTLWPTRSTTTRRRHRITPGPRAHLPRSPRTTNNNSTPRRTHNSNTAATRRKMRATTNNSRTWATVSNKVVHTSRALISSRASTSSRTVNRGATINRIIVVGMAAATG